MKIIHTSDLHLGIYLYEYAINDEQEFMINQLINITKENDIGAFIIAGDVFDKAIVSQKALRLYDELVTRLCTEINIPVLICAGNHDSSERLALCNKMLAKLNLYIEGRLQSEIKPISIGNCDFYLIPHFNLDMARSVFPDENFESYQQAYSFVCDKIRSGMDKGKKNIIIGHCFVAGATLSESDRSAKLGGAEQVSASVFDGFDYVALGHLHAPHNITENVRYSGTPYKYSFGEAKSQKTVTIFDTDKNEITEIPVAFERDLRVLEGTYLELLEIAENDDRKDDYMKIIVKDRYPTGDIYDVFKRYYENILCFEGMTVKSESNMSTLTAKEVVKLTPIELLKDYYSNKTDAQLGEFELEWFEKAIIAVKGGEDKQ